MKARNKVTGEVVSNFGWSEEYGAVCYTDKDGNVRQVSCTEEWELLNDVDWAAYRREAAKDIACSIVPSVATGCGEEFIKYSVRVSIELADELIKQLQSK